MLECMSKWKNGIFWDCWRSGLILPKTLRIQETNSSGSQWKGPMLTLFSNLRVEATSRCFLATTYLRSKSSPSRWIFDHMIETFFFAILNTIESGHLRASQTLHIDSVHEDYCLGRDKKFTQSDTLSTPLDTYKRSLGFLDRRCMDLWVLGVIPDITAFRNLGVIKTLGVWEESP